MPAGSSRHIEPLLPGVQGDAIAWQDGTVLRWQTGEGIVWQSFHGPSVQWARIAQRRVVLHGNARKARTTFVVPTALVVTKPPVDVVHRTRPLRAIARRRIDGTFDVAPAIPFPNPKPRRARATATSRPRRLIEAPLTQIAPVDASVMWSSPSSWRKLRGTARRARHTVEVIPPPLPFPFATVTQPKRRAHRRVVRRPVEVVPPQFFPLFPFTDVVQPKRFRGIFRGKARHRAVVPPQELFPALVTDVQARRLRALRARRARPVETPLPQLLPYPFSPVVQPRRARAFLSRKARPVEAVPLQVVVTNPDLVFTARSTARSRGILRRRARTIETIPAQVVAPTNPDLVFTARQSTRRAMARRNRRPIETTPAQVTPITPFTPFTAPQARRLRGLLRRPPIRPGVVVAQDTPLASAGPAKRRVLRPRRSRPVEATVLQLAPVAELTQPRRPRTLRIRRARVEAPVAQVTVVDASVMWSPRLSPRRTLVRRARRSIETVPAQFVPPFPFGKVNQPRRIRAMAVRRASQRVRTETRVPERIYFPKIRLF